MSKDEIIKPKSNKELQNIIDGLVYNTITRGESLRAVERYVETLNVPKRQRQYIVEQTRFSLEESADLDPKVIKGLCIVNAQHIYKRLYEEGDYAGALKALKEIFRFTNAKINEHVYETEDSEEEIAEET